jgi:hypothetical protein
MQTVVIALCVVLVCVLVWVLVRKPKWGNLDFWKATLREDPDDIYARSTDGPDGEAQLALDRTQARIANPRIQGDERLGDRHRLSRILRLSFLPLFINRSAAAGGADTDGAEVGRMLLAIRDNHDAIAAQLVDDIPGAQLARAREFAEHPGQHAHVRPDPAFMIAELDAAEQLGRVFHFDYPPASDVITTQNAKERRAAAVDVAETPAQAAGLYLDMSQTHYNDSQNSHDPAVNAAVREFTARLRNDSHTLGMASRISVDDIKDAFAVGADDYTRDPRTGRPRPLILTTEVLPVIERTKNGEKISRDGWSIGDNEILRLVWARSYHPSNAGNAQKMRAALFDALADCSTEGLNGQKIMCVNGRVSRIIGSLAMLDFDEDTWNVSREEDIRNDILKVAADTLNSAAATLMEDSRESAGVRAAAAEYGGREPGDSPATEEEEERARSILTSAMVEAANGEVEAINRRVPGAVCPSMHKKIAEDLQWVLA